MTRRWLGLAGLSVWTLGAAVAGATAPVGPEVRERLARSPRVDVVVALQPPATAPRSIDGVRRRARDIARRASALIATVEPQVKSGDIAIHRRFDNASGFTASVSQAGLEALAREGDVVRVDLAQQGSAALAHSVLQINADIVHALGIDGRGVTLAVLDTAIDTSHPDLQGHIVHEECFCSGNCCPGDTNRLSGPGSAAGTGHVHGTHVTGIIVSSGDNGIASIGVAPGAKVVAIRVLDDHARGTVGDWIAALDWIATNRPDVRAVNMSLVSDDLYPPNCEQLSASNMLFRQVIDALRAQGTVVFAASGNNLDPEHMAAPACIATAVAVGAVDRNDSLALFSNTDSSLDLLAPGVSIRSDAPGAATAVLSGTSMAVAHATGAAALLWNADSSLTPDEVEAYLKSTGVPVTDIRNGLTFPRIDAFAAYKELQFHGDTARGGGSDHTDCLVEWRFDPGTRVRSRTRAVAVCRDGDASCDHDDVPGQCSFNVSLCFNVPDGRIAHCRTNDPIVALHLYTPGSSPDPIDTANAVAVFSSLPAMPVQGENVCAAPAEVRVPVRAHGHGERRIRLTATSFERQDTDVATLVCHGTCPGDCNEDGRVTVDELATGVAIALDQRPLAACPAADVNGDGSIGAGDAVSALNAALRGCP